MSTPQMPQFIAPPTVSSTARPALPWQVAAQSASVQEASYAKNPFLLASNNKGTLQKNMPLQQKMYYGNFNGRDLYVGERIFILA